ncbi:MAG: PDZ domain-containing protein [Planctomycetes bacterium]|nr:PDZ domain-containing protein [Planctomycetota bacterium]
MNISLPTPYPVAGFAALTAAVVLAAAPAFAGDVEVVQTRPGLEVISVIGDPDHNETAEAGTFEARLYRADDDNKIEVIIRDGDVSAVLNGEEVPGHRIRHGDDRIVILDGAGDEIETIWIGNDRAFRWQPNAQAPAEEPKVMLGIHLGTPSPALEHHLKLAPGTTTMIEALYEGLPAHAAGIGEFDIITAIDGRTPADPGALREVLAGKNPGETIRLRVIHEGEPRTVNVRLKAFDRAEMSNRKLIGKARPQAREMDFLFGPGQEDAMRRFGVDIEELMPGMIFDDHERVFELAPGDATLRGFMRQVPDPHEPDPADEGEARTGDDVDMREIDARLEALERMLEELLKDR